MQKGLVLWCSQLNCYLRCLPPVQMPVQILTASLLIQLPIDMSEMVQVAVPLPPT